MPEVPHVLVTVEIQTILQEQNIETDEHSEAYKSRAQSATQRRWPAVSKLQKTE
jgi:hypothetical protein